MLNLEDILPPIVPDNPAQWLENNIYFDNIVSPNNAGNLSLTHQPWARDILNQVLNPNSKEIILACGAQVGKSTICLLASLLLVRFKPAPLMWLLPTDKLATRAIKRRFIPLLECNPDYASLLPPPKEARADSINLTNGAPIYYAGARTPNKLASIPAKYLILDESAKFEKVNAKEADPISLAKERTKSYQGSLVIQASTPNIKENKFWQSFENSSRGYWFMPCPNCGREFKFEWNADGVQWEKDKPETAHIICPHCKAKIDDEARRKMIKAGHWEHENKEAFNNGVLGFHLNSLYSPYITLAEMAKKYVEAVHSLIAQDELRNFFNSWLALPYEEYLTKVQDSDIADLINPIFHKDIVPDNMLFLCTCYDVGQNQTHYATTAYCADGKYRVIDWGTLIEYKSVQGKMGASKHIESLLYYDRAGNEIRPDFGFIDSGFETQEVYAECKRTLIDGYLKPSKGTVANVGSWGKSQVRTFYDLELYTYSDFQLKKALYVEAVNKQLIELPAETDKYLIQGLSGQEMKKTKSGKVYFKEVAQDHYGDCVKLAVLASWVWTAESFSDIPY